MGIFLSDSIWVNVTTTGTGTFSLGTPLGGYRTFLQASVPNGAVVHYSARTATEFENGEGVYDSGANTLTRVTVFASSAGAPTKTNFATTPTLAIAPLSEDAILPPNSSVDGAPAIWVGIAGDEVKSGTLAELNAFLMPFLSRGTVSLSSSPQNINASDSGKMHVNSGAPRTANLPPPIIGSSYAFYANGFAITLDTPGAELIVTPSGNVASLVTPATGYITIHGDGSNWIMVASSFNPAASSTLAGFARLATQAEAEAGVHASAVMTPERFVQSSHANVYTLKNIAGRNGGLEVWQRGLTVAIPASVSLGDNSSYTADGWFLVTNAAQASVVSMQPGIIVGSLRCARILRNNGQTGTGIYRFCFPMDTDELVRLRGKQVVLSFAARGGANWSPSSGLLQFILYTGTGAGPIKRGPTGFPGEATPLSSSVTVVPGGGGANYVSAVSSVIGSTITQAEIQFYWNPTGTAGAADYVEIDDVDLRIVPAGTTSVTPTFERLDYSLDVARCQRFLEKTYNLDDPLPAIGAAIAFIPVYVASLPNNSWWLAYYWNVPKRANPTVKNYSYNGTLNVASQGLGPYGDYAANSALAGSSGARYAAIGNFSGGALAIVGAALSIQVTGDASI